MDIAELDKRFTHHPPGEVKQRHHEALRAAYREMAAKLNALCPDSRELSLAMTSLEESLMWGNAAIARNDLTSDL
jgi:hypothetical protein